MGIVMALGSAEISRLLTRENAGGNVFTPNDRRIAEYFVAELLEKLPPGLLSVLTVLSFFSGS